MYTQIYTKKKLSINKIIMPTRAKLG